MSEFDDDGLVERADAFVGAFGLIRTQDEDSIRYLAVEEDDCLDFVRAVRGEGEGYRDAIDRTVAARLGLRRGKDYIVSSVPRSHLNSRLCGGKLGRGEDTPIWYVCQFFVVNLFGREGRERISNRTDVRWLSPRDVYRGHGPDGTPLREDLRQLLKMADAVPADELA